MQNATDANQAKLNEMQGQQAMFDEQLARASLVASDQRISFGNQMARAALDASDQQTSFDEQMARASLAASDQRITFGNQMARAALDASDQQTSFDEQMARASVAASDQRISFSNQLARAALDASDQQTSFNSQMAKAAMEAGDMKVAYNRLARASARRENSRNNQVLLSQSPSPGGGSSQSGQMPLRAESPRRRPPAKNASSSGGSVAQSHGSVTIFFSDLIGFSTWAHELPPETVMSTLDDLYTRLDDIILCEMPGIYKVSNCWHSSKMVCVLELFEWDDGTTWLRYTGIIAATQSYIVARVGVSCSILHVLILYRYAIIACLAQSRRWRPSEMPTWPLPTWWSRTHTMRPQWSALRCGRRRRPPRCHGQTRTMGPC